MKNKENMELLTAELYQKISGDKRDKIVTLKKIKTEVLSKIEEERVTLQDLEKQKAEIESQINLSKANLGAFKLKKFKLIREIGIQKRLSSKITKLFTKDDSYIDVTEFYPEDKASKKR